jgi:anti-anti-sigma factor
VRHKRWRWPVTVLDISVDAGQSGAVVVLAGEADPTSVTRLNEVLTAQLSGKTTHLTIDASNLLSADSMAIRALWVAALILKDRGGRMVLLHPQQPVRRMLNLLGVDQTFTIRETQDGKEPDGSLDSHP